MLDREDVRRLIDEVGLSEYAEAIVDAVRSGYHLDLDPDADPTALGMSKIGGDPDLVDDEQWPVSRRGARMVFLAQIDLSSAPALPDEWPATTTWPHTGGIVRVFANLLQDWGEPCAARILVAAPDVALVRTSAPEISLPLSPDTPYADDELVGTDRELPEAAVRLVPFLTLPSSLDEVGEHDERYLTLSERLRADGAVRTPRNNAVFNHQLLGQPLAIQEDPRRMGAYVVEEAGASEQVNRPGFLGGPIL